MLSCGTRGKAQVVRVVPESSVAWLRVEVTRHSPICRCAPWVRSCAPTLTRTSRARSLRLQSTRRCWGTGATRARTSPSCAFTRLSMLGQYSLLFFIPPSWWPLAERRLCDAIRCSVQRSWPLGK